MNDTQSIKPDISKIMQELREQIVAESSNKRDRQAFEFKPADLNAGQRKAGELLNSEELRYLNTNYNMTPTLDLNGIQSHRPGIIGKTIVTFKKKVLSTIWYFLKDYFIAEREYNAHLVRFLNDVSKYVDSRDASNFWELIRKIDVDVTRALERIERLHDEYSASGRSTEKRVYEALDQNLHALRQSIADLNAQSVQHSDKLKVLESVASGLESVISRIHEKPSISLAQESNSANTATDYSYLLLENRFRGSEEEIQKRQEIYPPIFKSVKQKVLDIGAGRGELLRLFKQNNIASYAVDIDRSMVEASTQAGFDARLGDGIAHLRSLENASLGGVIALQVVEHLTKSQLEELMRLCLAKVEKNGKVVFETINPRSVLALSSNYFRDPTHVWPLHPDTLAYIMTQSGLVVEEIRFLAPVAKEAQLREIPTEEYMTPRWAHAISLINHNFSQLNDLLYGHQDYCVIAKVP